MQKLIMTLHRILSKILRITDQKKHEIELIRYPELKRVYSAFENSPKGKWIIGKNNALYLYKLVLNIKPRKVLELGTGIGAGTSAIALALRRLGKGSIISLEQSPKCIEIAHELIETSLKKRIQIICAKPDIFRIEKISKWIYFSGYDWVLQEGDIFDFVVIDGPGRWLQDGELITLVNGDLFRILPHLAEGCKIFIDGRRSTVEIIERYLSNYFMVLEKNSLFTLFEKNKTRVESLDDLQIVDKKLEQSREYLKNNIIINAN